MCEDRVHAMVCLDISIGMKLGTWGKTDFEREVVENEAKIPSLIRRLLRKSKR